VADRRERIIFSARWLGGVLTGSSVNLIESLSLVVVRFKILVLQRPFRRKTIFVTKALKILFAQTKERSPINLGVAADVIAEARSDLVAFPVIHRFRGVVLERAVIAPVVLFPRQERAAFEDKDLLSTMCQSVKQASTARSRSDDYDIEMLRHTRFGRACQRNLTGRIFNPEARDMCSHQDASANTSGDIPLRSKTSRRL
jgi:hypothetical protein